jgi:AcrR family transcriptional regulator
MSTAPSGRPRDPRISDAALEAARELLLEVGYSAMSIDLVARRAGVNRPAMYRRWPTLAHLVHDALYGEDRRVTIEETGDLGADLRALALDVARSYSRPEVQAALAGMVSDLSEHPELRAVVIDRLEDQVRGQFVGLLERAVARGDARPVDPNVVLDTIVGALYHRMIARRDGSLAFVDDVVDLVLAGMLPVPAGESPAVSGVPAAGRGSGRPAARR